MGIFATSPETCVPYKEWGQLLLQQCETCGAQDWEEGDGKYVAPELLNGHMDPTPAADIYSLGATLYECATGDAVSFSSFWCVKVNLPGEGSQ